MSTVGRFPCTCEIYLVEPRRELDGSRANRIYNVIPDQKYIFENMEITLMINRTPERVNDLAFLEMRGKGDDWCKIISCVGREFSSLLNFECKISILRVYTRMQN